jgi:hypothetical protein
MLTYENDQGAASLDQQQSIDQRQGYAVIPSGGSLGTECEVTVNTGTLGQNDTLSLASGSVLFDGSVVSVSAQNVQIDGSNTNPRKDVVYIDGNGDPQVKKGSPATVPSEAPGDRFQTWKPGPYGMHDIDGVVLATIWVPGGASSIGSVDRRDRRLPADETVNKLDAQEVTTEDLNNTYWASSGDTQSVRDALAKANSEEGTVFVPPGTYDIQDNWLVIREGVDLKASNSARFVRADSDLDAMLVNGDGETVSTYNGEGDTTIEGGVWDGAGDTHSTSVTPIAIGAASDVTVRDVTITDVYDWHGIEFNSVQNGRILDCDFFDNHSVSGTRGMIQLDPGSGGFFWLDISDDSGCQDIEIRGCRFENRNVSRNGAGIDSKGSASDEPSRNFKITDCTFVNLERGLNIGSVDDLTIRGCHFVDSATTTGQARAAVALLGGSEMVGVTISDCRFVDLDERAIVGDGDDGTDDIQDVRVTDCRFENVGDHACGFNYCDSLVVKGCRFQDVKGGNATAVWSYGTPNARVIGCHAENTDGIQLGENGGSLTSRHIAKGNTASKIVVHAADECIVTDNAVDSITDNQEGGSVEIYENFIGGTFVASGTS